MDNYCYGFYFCGCGSGFVVGGGELVVGGGPLVVGCGSVCGDWGVLTLVMDFREVMLTSPPELAHCPPPLPPTPGHLISIFSPHYSQTGAWDLARRTCMSSALKLARRGCPRGQYRLQGAVNI